MDTSQLATKADIEELKQSTKTDIEELKQTTKTDLQKLGQATRTDIKSLKQTTKIDIQKLETKLDRLQNTLDGFVSVVDDLRTENTVGTYQISELQKRAEEHEERLKAIESFKQTT